jgi:WD40 repeat protein
VIVSGSYDASVRVWDATTGQPVGAALTGHTGSVSAVAVGRAGDRDVIVSGATDASVRVWDATTGSPLITQDTLDTVHAIAVTNNLLTLAAGTAICTARID